MRGSLDSAWVVEDTSLAVWVEKPNFEYGAKFLPRRNDVVVHGSLQAAIDALEELPVLKASGECGIVRRLIHEPGDWELVTAGDEAPAS